jgi:hypothetical protein
MRKVEVTVSVAVTLVSGCSEGVMVEDAVAVDIEGEASADGESSTLGRACASPEFEAGDVAEASLISSVCAQ